MSISSFFGSAVVVLRQPNNSVSVCTSGGALPHMRRARVGVVTAPPEGGWVGGGVQIECSSRPQKKATAHHRKTRPKKSQPWDIRRGPTVYPPLPPLPAEWTLVSSSATIDTTSTDSVISDPSQP
ncbi:Ribosomal protein L6 [Macleaya cordata]|uniref:Ribosomal protein L6 n=1 Tax=Macleaya cordata TaxID=56857 RepID=A0A200QA63_MACCD|nr:Ribosomal protein L6 [Macleaya cordata]